MLSKTSEYALRAMIHLAQHKASWPMAGSRIASDVNIPVKYLSKVLGDLVRAGLLESVRGKKGGFGITRPIADISLLEIVVPFERFAEVRCPFGSAENCEEHPCTSHEKWKNVVNAQQDFLSSTTLLEVAGQHRAAAQD